MFKSCAWCGKKEIAIMCNFFYKECSDHAQRLISAQILVSQKEMYK